METNRGVKLPRPSHAPRLRHFSYDTLLQNAAAILLQNATEFYYKMPQVFYYKMRPLLQIATVQIF